MKRLIAILLGGGLFGYGLAWGGMTRPEVVLSFLQLRDLGLLLLMTSALAVTTTTTTWPQGCGPRPCWGCPSPTR